MEETAETVPRRGRPGYDQETVLRRAIELFNRQGYDGTSVGDIARELGLSKSAIYHHVPSKEHLLSQALDEALDGLAAAVDRATSEADSRSAYERLRTVVEESVGVLVAHQPAVTLLLRVRGNSPVEVAALRRRRELDARLADLVREAIEEGSLRDDIDPVGVDVVAQRARRGQPAAVRHGQLARRVAPPRWTSRPRHSRAGRGDRRVRRARPLGLRRRSRRSRRR